MVDRSLTLGTLFSANVRDFVQKVDLIKKKVGQLNATMASVGKQAKGLDKTTGAVGRMGKSMDKTGRSGKKFTSQLGLMGSALSTVGAAAKTTAAFFAAGLAISTLTKGLAAGTREIIDFDQALKNLQAITKSTDAEVIGMGEVIKQVATDTKFSTGEVAEGMVLLGQAGFSVQEAMQAMASVANLATGTLSDLKMTSDLLTTTIRAFNLSTVESARVSDVMANAINRSKLTIDKLRIAFNFVGAASSQAGLSIEETAGSMMILANNGLRASTIGTGLRQVMSRLLAPNRKLREAFKEQGIALERVNPATQGWTNALQNLIPLLINAETGLVDMSKAYQLFGLRGAQAVAILAKGVASGDYQKMIEFTMEVGSASRMAATQMEGLGVKLKNLADRMKLIAVALGEAGLTAAFKVLVDTLRATAKAVTDFINTDVGQLVVAFAGWTFAIWGTIKALNILIKTIVFAGAAIKGRFLASMLAVGGATGTAAAGFSSLSLILIKTIGRFLKVGIIIGAVITVVRHFVTSIQRQIDSLEKFDTKTQTVIQTLGLYASKLEELVKKKEKDEDVTKAHSKTIERFQQAIEQLEKGYGKLDISLDDNTEALEDNLKAINKLKEAELEKSVKSNIDLIDKYSKQIERTNFWLAAWNFTVQDTIGWAKNLSVAFNLLGNRMIDSVGASFELLIEKLKEVGPAAARVAESLEYLGDKWGQFWKWAGEKVDEFVEKYKGDSKKIAELTEAQRNAFIRAAKGLDLLGKGARSIESIVEELETLSGKKIDIKGIDAINDALKKTSFTLDEQKKKWNETFDDLPAVFKEMYQKMDILRKVDFDKFLKQLKAKEVAFDKTADIMGLSEGEIAAGRAVIRGKELRRFEEDQKKEVKINAEAVDAMLTNLDYLVRKTDEAYNKRTTNILNHYFEEYDISTKSRKQLIKLEEQFSAEMKKVANEREEKLGALGQTRNRVLRDLERQTVREITKLNTKMYKDLKTQLNSRLKDARKNLKDLEGDILDLQKSRREKLREINQLTMTDEEKWLNDRREVHVLFNKALETYDEDYYKTAIDLAAGLAREVTDKNGEVIRTVSDTQSEAKNLMLSLFLAQEDALKNSVAEQKKTIMDLKESLATINQKFVDMKNKIEEINSTELALKMEDSLRDMEEMHSITSKFKTEWDSLHSKAITLTVKYKYEGGAPSTSGTESEGAETHPTTSEAEGQRWGGLIKRKIGGYIRKAFGGKLPGFGGGDKVKSLLEPGEFVIRKEAVRKYGEGVFSSLNNMKVSSANVGEAVAQKIGGVVKKMAQAAPIQKFAMGGGVSSGTSGAAPKVINIYLQPKYMTGDRQAMRAVAADISRALDEQNKRWGGR